MSNNITPPSASGVHVYDDPAHALHEPLQDSPSMSTKDKQLKSTLYLKEVSERLIDVTTELTELHRLFISENNLGRTQSLALTALRMTLLPFLKESSKNIRDASKILSPIAGIEYVHNRHEVKRKRSAHQVISTEKRSRKSESLLRLEHATSDRSTLRPVTNTVCPDAVAPRTQIKRKCCLPTIISSILPPLNKIEYSRTEIVSILSRLPKGSANRSNLINHFVQKKLVPISRDGIYKFMRKQEEGAVLKEEWKLPGRHRLLTELDITTIKDDLKKRSGSTISKREIATKIESIQQQKVIAQGRVPITKHDMNPCKGTLINYQCAIADSVGVSITTSIVPKTRTRYTAENSLISAMALVCVVAATHYDVSTEVQIEHEHVMNKVPLEVPDGVKLLYRLVGRTYGNDVPIIPVRPEMILSTDDTVQYIFEGKGAGKDLFRLVASKALKKAGTRSKFMNDDSKNMCGMRVKLTYTFSGAGIMAPIFITVLGLNERELPQGQCVSLKIPGLCVGGGGVTVGSKGFGILMFMRGEQGIDKHRYEIYRDEILVPFIRQSRTEFGGWEEGTPIPEDMKAVSWCDGDLAQIENIVSPDSLPIYKENMISAAKQNAARSGTEQFADLTKTFKQMQTLQKVISVSNVPIERHPMKKMIFNELKDLQNQQKLLLKPSKKNSIIDFIASVPGMTAKSVTRDNIIHGVLENGMLDSKQFRYPDFDKMLATCRLDPTKDEYKLCVNPFLCCLRNIWNMVT